MMEAPKRFLTSRGQRLQPGQKLVGRNTRWGNPFPMAGKIDPEKPPRLVRHYAEKWGIEIDAMLSETDRAAVRRFREALLAGKLDYRTEDVQASLAGFDLGCPCGSEHCHADVLLDIANR